MFTLEFTNEIEIIRDTRRFRLKFSPIKNNALRSEEQPLNIRKPNDTDLSFL